MNEARGCWVEGKKGIKSVGNVPVTMVTQKYLFCIACYMK